MNLKHLNTLACLVILAALAVNGFGEAAREERTGGNILTQRSSDAEYDVRGRLIKIEKTGRPIEQRFYNEFGEYTNVTLVGRSPRDHRQTKRIRETDTRYIMRDGELYSQTVVTLRSNDTSIAPLVTTNLVQLSGLSLANESHEIAIEPNGRITETFTSLDIATSTRTKTTIASDTNNPEITQTTDGKTTLAISHSAVTNTIAYDAYHRETSRTDGNGNATTKSYNPLGQLVAETDSSGATTTYAYDSCGNTIAITNTLGNATIYEYDIRGNRTYEGGAVYPVRYTYDEFNIVTNMTTYRVESVPPGDATTWIYDEATGLLLQKIYADGNETRYSYDEYGRLATRTLARGITTSYTYDEWEHIANIEYSDGTPSVSIFYDAFGRETNAIDAAGVTTFTYNAFGALTNETTIGIAGTNVIERFHDIYGRPAGYAHNGVRMTEIHYDASGGRIASMGIPLNEANTVSNQGTGTFTWYYHVGRDLKSSLSYPNGLVASWTYDSRSNLTQVRNAFPTNVISQYDYSYDSLSRRTAIVRSGSAMTETRTDVYCYNPRNELISSRKAADNAPEHAYQYDDIGNRVSSFELGTNRIYTANSLNQYTSISNLCVSSSSAGEFIPQYDLDGNQTLIQTATGIWQVSYNGENRPVIWTSGPTNIVMTYDRLGRRVTYLETVSNGGATITNSFRTFTYDGYLQIANTDHVASVAQAYIWDPTEPIATRPLVFYQTDNLPQFYTHDAVKNVSELLKANGALNAHFDYSGTGGYSVSLSKYNSFAFSSEYSETLLGLVYYNFRWYDCRAGRWCSRDPVLQGSLFSIPEYSYCANRYLSLTDWLGLAYGEHLTAEEARQLACKINSVLRWARLAVPVADLFLSKEKRKTHTLAFLSHYMGNTGRPLRVDYSSIKDDPSLRSANARAKPGKAEVVSMHGDWRTAIGGMIVEYYVDARSGALMGRAPYETYTFLDTKAHEKHLNVIFTGFDFPFTDDCCWRGGDSISDIWMADLEKHGHAKSFKVEIKPWVVRPSPFQRESPSVLLPFVPLL